MGRKKSTYGIASIVAGNDEWIGTDVSNADATMNFTPDVLSLYYIKNGLVDPARDGLIFTYKALPTTDIKGAFNLPTDSASNIALDNTLTSVVVSNLDNERTNIRPLLNYLVGADVKILNPARGDEHNYAIYTIDSVTDRGTSFATLALTFVTGNPSSILAFGSTVALAPISSSTSNATPFVLGDHSVTELNDVTSAGSGAIITDTERTNLGGLQTWRTTAEPKLDGIATQANRARFSPNAVTGATFANSVAVVDSAGNVNNFNFDDITPLSDAPDTNNILMGLDVNGTNWRIRSSATPTQGNFIQSTLDLSFSGQTDDGAVTGDVTLTPAWTVATGATLTGVALSGPGITGSRTVPVEGTGDAIVLNNVALAVGRHTWTVTFTGTDDEGVDRTVTTDRTLTIAAPTVFARAGFNPEPNAADLTSIGTFSTSTQANPSTINANTSGTGNGASYIWLLLERDVRFTIIEDGGGPIAFEAGVDVTIGGIEYEAYRSTENQVDQGGTFMFPLTIRYS